MILVLVCAGCGRRFVQRHRTWVYQLPAQRAFRTPNHPRGYCLPCCRKVYEQ